MSWSTFSYIPTPDVLKNEKPYPIHKTPTIMTSENELCGAANRAQSSINTTLAWVSFQERCWIVLQTNFCGILEENQSNNYDQCHSNKYPLQRPQTLGFSSPHIFSSKQHRKVIDSIGFCYPPPMSLINYLTPGSNLFHYKESL